MDSSTQMDAAGNGDPPIPIRNKPGRSMLPNWRTLASGASEGIGPARDGSEGLPKNPAADGSKAHRDPEKLPVGGTAAGSTGDRLVWLDTFRGVAILAVLLIHILGRFLDVHDIQSGSRLIHLGPIPLGSPDWTKIAMLERACHFAVPGFLLLSALVNTASLLRKPALGRFLKARLQSTLWPYLVWSGIFMGYLAWRNDAVYQWPLIEQQLLLGKAYEHLYFLWILLQMLIVLPLLVKLFHKPRSGALMLLVTTVVTIGCYYLNKFYIYDRWPDFARSMFWYVPSIVIGIWMGSQVSRVREILRKGWPLALAVTSAGLVVYFPLALSDEMHHRVNTMQYQVGEWCYTTAFSFLLLFLCWGWGEGKGISALLRFLGRYSLQIYLIHPLVLLELDRAPDFTYANGLAGAFGLDLILCIVAPLLVVLALRLGLSPVLFGR